ncbi:LYR motif-containing protein bcn92 isoform X1 [Rhynchophorus ferrugineus]|uniref:LYR motif-containing protein bcn92 isoform X1 n=1 Tax=Rhynchophorus ferrugineus TaxID=354439 RepID=UPI003FCECF20
MKRLIICTYYLYFRCYKIINIKIFISKRSYAVRRVKDAFRENQNLGNGNALREKISEGHKNLEIIKRQVLISQMYKTDRLIIENMARN